MVPFPGYLDRHRVVIARAAALLAIVGGTVYLVWRAQMITELGPAAWAFFVAEVFTFLTLVSAVPLMWTPRPRRWAPPPRGTLDVFITVANEPLEMVEATLQAALDIDYPHETYILNDGEMAGSSTSGAIEALAARFGVTCFTRTDGARGKAGNLNNALRRTDGEFVAVIDADHLARPDLADDLLGHFHPRVAFVATRQDFRLEANDWLNNTDFFFYAVIQPAKDRDNAAFSCGNGVIYRRTALDDIGGFSEWNLVEDLHTSYQLHARGWQSVYVPRPVTTGTAPSTAAELAAQRLRWATDSLRLFFWDNPFVKKGLSWRQRIHYGQTTGIYYLATAFQVVFLLCPVLTLLFGIDVLQVDSAGQYLTHLLAFGLPFAVMLVAFAGVRGAVRLVQMQSFLAPVFCVAAFRALRMRDSSTKAFSGVTRKTSQQTMSRITLLQWSIFVLLVGSVGFELARDWGIEWGAVLWALVMAVSLCAQNSMVSMKWDVTHSMRIALTAPVAVALLVALLSVWAPLPGASPTQVLAAQSGPANAPVNLDPAPQPHTRLLPPRRGVYMGVYDADFQQGEVSTAEYGDANMRILHRYQQWWGDSRDFDRTWADKVAEDGRVPMITWEPWLKPENSVTDPDQRPELLDRIADGEWDDYIERYAAAAADYRNPMVIRFMHEVNGTWYPWAAEVNGNTPQAFQRAFRHVHGIFERAGASNVSWVFGIDSHETSTEELETLYPGDDYVDWVGLSGFNWGPEGYYALERSFLAAFKSTVDLVTPLGKPVMLSEVGTSALSLDPAGWLEGALSDVRELPSVKAMVLFNADTPDADFRLTDDALGVLSRDATAKRLAPRMNSRLAR